MSELSFLTVSELSRAFDTKTLSPVEVLDDVLRRLDILEPRLNMFAALDVEGARACARESEERQMRGERRSLLDGIPTSIKDLIAQKGLPLRFGSRSTSDVPATIDAPAVERLRAAGAVLLGKSTTSEFGCKAVGDCPLTGITRNPWNIEMTPGGSSCGAAAMVSAGVVPFAIGTDGGGSVRIPASLTGLFGVKAQFGRVPVHPVSATPTLAHVGPLARTVEDAAIVLSHISGHDRRDPYSVAGPVPNYLTASRSKRRLKIAWSTTLGFAKPEPEVVALTTAAVKRFEELGHEVQEFDHVMDDPEAMWNAEFYAGVGTRLKSVVVNSPDLVDPAVLEVLRVAIAQDMHSYYSRVFDRYAFRNAVREFFEHFDLLATPTLPVPAFAAGIDFPPSQPNRSIVSWVYYTYPFNLTGQPAASINAGFTGDGLPVGLQLVAGINDEETIFTACGAYERAFGDTDRRPPLIV